MSSVSLVRVRGSKVVLVTVAVKVNGPPGAGVVVGSGVLVTRMVGVTGVTITFA